MDCLELVLHYRSIEVMLVEFITILAKWKVTLSFRHVYVTLRFLVHLDEAVRYMVKWKHFVTSVLLRTILVRTFCFKSNCFIVSLIFVCLSGRFLVASSQLAKLGHSKCDEKMSSLFRALGQWGRSQKPRAGDKRDQLRAGWQRAWNKLENEAGVGCCVCCTVV